MGGGPILGGGGGILGATMSGAIGGPLPIGMGGLPGGGPRPPGMFSRPNCGGPLGFILPIPIPGGPRPGMN